METPWQMTCWRKICSFKRRSWENDCSEAAIFKPWVLWELKHQNTSSPFFFTFVCSVSTDRWRPPLRFMRLESNRLRRVSDGVWKTLRNIKDSDSQRAEYGSLGKVRKVNVYICFFGGKLCGSNRLGIKRNYSAYSARRFWLRSNFEGLLSMWGQFLSAEGKTDDGTVLRWGRIERSSPLVLSLTSWELFLEEERGV